MIPAEQLITFVDCHTQKEEGAKVITPQNVIEPSVGIHGPSAEGVTPPTSPGRRTLVIPMWTVMNGMTADCELRGLIVVGAAMATEIGR